ncbi:MAG: Uma2 family endonuclease [Armatimonadetes bacterium]|nr:Uma2 family endonuclease [Armatimonadota bacterium]
MKAITDKSTNVPVYKNGANGHAPIVPTRDELIAALYKEPGKAEIINGRIERFNMTGRTPGFAGEEIFLYLRLFVKATKPPSIAVGDNKAFLCDLPHRQSFAPDAAYYKGENSGMKFFPTPPQFAVEVRSENDYGTTPEREMEAKRADYFAAGTLVFWDVDPLSSDAVIRKFTKTGGAETPVAVFKRGDVADAEPAVPGFTVKIDDLFE